MNKFVKGIAAGLVATIVLSVLMIMKGKMGLMPDVNVIAMLASKMGGNSVMAWVAHFMIGMIGYGIAYVVIFSKLPFSSVLLRGVALGMAGWMAMMIVIMPMMNAGLFGLNLASGMMVPVATLMLHVIFGAVLSFVNSKL